MREPIAIVGMACRFPGAANSLDEYWQLLDQSRDAIQEIPVSRWDTRHVYDPHARLGKTQSRWAGLITDIDLFDPQIFGISPREAARMDPQQRLLLEVAWRALEDAGQPFEGLAGRPVSVFVGISSWDYAFAGLCLEDRGVIDAYSNTGGSFSIAANRISYCFDLRGPSVAVDTACSSSLVAVHLACETLWQGQASLALAGGANALLMPDFFVAFSQLGVLSPTGRCRAFDAQADGYVRGEGAGMVVLKPLSAAIQNHDRIYAVIRASAVNQDGRTPGLTVPSQEAQQQLVQLACQRAGIEPREIQYVEAHGTGTPVGDPIEARALASVLCLERESQKPCWMGSVKTNIGHLESGAGIASVIKVALAIHHGRIPAHLHFQSPHPEIDFTRLGLRIPTSSMQWPDEGALRTAGINGFGYGGANAHVILQQSPSEQGSPSVRTTTSNGSGHASGPYLLALSAKSHSGLLQRLRNWQAWLDQEGRNHNVETLSSTIAHRHSHWEHRLAVSGSQHDDWLAELESQFQRLSSAPQSIERHAADAGIVFACCGQGPQRWGMGLDMFKHSTVFREIIEACDAEFQGLGCWSLVDELRRGERDSRLSKTSFAQPALFAIQVALAEVWKSYGIVPAAVVGHSVGEIAAAYLAGVLSWRDACCVAFHRGRTMDRVTSVGRMLAVSLSAREAGRWLRETNGQVVVSAINGPNSLTLSGTAEEIDRLRIKFQEQGLFCRPLNVEYAFHSPQMDPVCDELRQCLSHITPQPPSIPIYSTVTGHRLGDERLDAEYWWHNVRQPVRFADSITRMAREPWHVFVELGPHPVLAYSINECYGAVGKRVWAIASLHRDVDDRRAIQLAVGQLYELGGTIDWDGLIAAPTKQISVPGHPIEKQRCWHESRSARLSRAAANGGHPLVGESLHAPWPAWHGRVDLRVQSYLQDHCVRRLCVLPAAGMLEGALWVAQQILETPRVRVENFVLHEPCVLTPDLPKWLQHSYDPRRRQLHVHFREVAEDDWSPLTTMTLSREQEDLEQPLDDLSRVRARCGEPVQADEFYAYCHGLGLEYGPSFQGVSGGWRRGTEALIDVRLPEALVPEAGNYTLHPAFLDSCFHAMVAADPDYRGQKVWLYLPSQVSELRFYRAPTEKLQVHARVRSKSERRLLADVDVYTATGQLVLSIREFESLRIYHPRDATELEELVYSYGWELAESTTDELAIGDQTPGHATNAGTDKTRDTHWILFADQGGLGESLAAHLAETGARTKLITPRTFWNTDDSEQEARHPRAREVAELLRDALAESSEAPIRMVYLFGLDSPANAELDTETLERSISWQTLSLLTLVQAWEQLAADRQAEMFVVTARAQSRDDVREEVSLVQSALIGFGRVVISEYGPWRTRLIDLPHPSLENLLCELTHDDDEDEVMWRDDARYLHRFRPHFSKPLSRSIAEHLPYHLPIDRSSSIEQLRYVAQTRRSLAADEVEIEVQAAGLNFSDVMKALGLYPGKREDDRILGAECAGTICRLGSDVRGWAVGERVMAVAPGAFGSHVVVPVSLIARVPTNLTPLEAAGVPISFLTAAYALHECARIRPGESVLVHAATGGVGMAALQVVQRAGARPLASAGSPEKRRLAADLGAQVVVTSRGLGFADQVRQATRGEGVDVILNSLAGEAIPRGLSILRPGGRFLEIGKRDIHADASLGMRLFRNNNALFGIDLDQLFQLQPARMGDLLRSIADQFQQGQLHSLMTTAFPAHRTKEAFRLMQQGKHVGKLVLDYTTRPAEVFPAPQPKLQLSPDASYWIVGGLGGFGLEIARWLIRCGARWLVLTNRRADDSEQVRHALEQMRAEGADVRVMPADVTRWEDVQDVKERISRELPPLRGVFHAAMVLEDRLLVDLDLPTLMRVLRPKVLGGWHLHQATIDVPLEHFVLFSSLTSIFGHAGQANYAAANAFLDSLGQFRRSQGLPGLTMNWGHLGGVGYLAERSKLGERLERQGVLSFSVEQATECLSYAMVAGETQLSVLRMDWTLWRGLGITTRVSPRFAHLLRHGAKGLETQDAEARTLDQWRQASRSECETYFQRQLTLKIAQLLGVSAERMDADVPLLNLGLDSLMAVELRNWVQSRFALSLPIASLMRSGSLRSVAESMAEAVSSQDRDREWTAERSAGVTDEQAISLEQAYSLLDEVHAFSEAEIDYWLERFVADNSGHLP